MARETTRRAQSIAMTGGGTAGHVFPGLAVAEELSRQWQGSVFWIGGTAGIERSLVDRAGLAFHSIPAGKLRRYFSLKNFTDVARVLAGVLSSIRILRRERPRVLFSKGGFVSVPPVVAARLLGIPCITHESDFDPGLATRINMRFCEAVCVSWPQTLSYLPPEAARRAVVTGNPVRAALASADPARGRAFAGCPPGTPLVLVIGGSQGSSFLNGLVASCLPRLRRRAFVAHQMGERDYAPALGPNYFAAGFIADEMPHLLAAADLVVCRSGANTLAELAVLGKPSILVPLSASGSRGDQLRNARMFCEAGAALLLGEETADGSALLAAVTDLLGDPARLADMGQRARGLARPDAAAAIAREILRRAVPPGNPADGLPGGELMFENIIGQRQVVATLCGEVADGRLPRAALFAGPAYSGKLSTALELARVLCCREGRGEWSCRCGSCISHKELANPHTVLLGARYSDVEIAASADALLRARKPATCYLFIRAVRKLTRRFDPAVCDTDEPRMKSAQAKAAQVEGLLLDLDPEAELPAERALADLTAGIIEACAQLAEIARTETIGVGQVRLLSAWAHATSESRKVAILENADRMLDSARNALLKLLEEPPEGVNLLLLTTRRSAILATVASRLRPYVFAERTPIEEAEVLSKIFREATPTQGLRGYFLAWKQINAEALAGLSRQFVERVLQPDPSTDILEDLGEVFTSRRTQKEASVSFLEELTLRLRELLREGSVPLELLERWTAWAREAAAKMEQYNVSPPAAVEELFLRMRSSLSDAVTGAGPSVQPPSAGAGGRRVKRFIQRALEKLDRLDTQQIGALIGQLSEQNELMDMVLESMTDGIVVTDADNRVLLYNKSAERLLALSGEVLENALWEAVADRDLAGYLFQKLLGQETVHDREFTLGGGSPRILSVSILPLVRQGSVQGSLVHLEDVTEKRSREARLRRAESLASLTTLAAGVAHEIKNPLGSMGIHLQLAQKKMAGKSRVDPRTISSHLGVIGEEVDRLNRIVVDFLFAVKPMDTRLEDGDINAVIRELLEFVRPELDQAGVRIDSRLSTGVPLLRIDPRFVKQALLNLIKNAVAAMPEGGTLTVGTERADNEVLVKVSDTGSGIPDDIMDKIFEPYFTTKPFGTGLGLTIVFKIVKEHFGDISVSSRVGEGTTFTIQLPVMTREKIMIDYNGGGA